MRNNNTGLTAVDILIVLVILVVIAAVMFPVFATHGDCSRKSTCQSNLKECAIALQVYWNDYDGTLPSSALVHHSKAWNARDYQTFATKIGQLPPAKNTLPRTWPQVLYNHMKSKDIMFCPSDTVDQADQNAQVSYWWKLAIDKAWYGEGCNSPCKYEKDFGFNSDQIILYEHNGWHFGDTSGFKDGIQINAAYLDSHVKTIQLKNCGSTYTTDPTMPAGGEPAWFNCNFDSETAAPTLGRFSDPRHYGDKL